MDSPKVFYNYGIYIIINWKHCALFMGCSQLIHSFKLLGYIEVLPKAVMSSLACSPLCVLSPVSRSAFQPFPFPLWKKAISLPFMKRHMHISWLATPGLLHLPFNLRFWVALGADGIFWYCSDSSLIPWAVLFPPLFDEPSLSDVFPNLG